MLKLVKLERKYYPLLLDMMEEWTATDEKIIPYAIRKNDYRNYSKYVRELDNTDTSGGMVPDSTYFCLDTERNMFVGAVNIRHYLNEDLLLHGGHIGDGVRPSERRKGVATQMIGLALDICREMGMDRVLMTCNKMNVGSARSIINNGGVLKDEVTEGPTVTQRYWINLQNN